MHKQIILIATLLTSLLTFAQDSTKSLFSLSEAQEYALINNTEVENARLDILIAKKKIWETTAIGLPQVSASLGHNYNIDLPTQLIPANVFNPEAPEDEFMEMKFGTDHSSTFDLQATQIIFSGEYIVGLQASRIYRQLSENQLKKTEKDIKQTISNSYQLILIAQERRNIIEKNIKNTQMIFQDTKALFEGGFAEETDFNQLQINLSTLNNALRSANRQISNLEDLLKFQMNIPNEESIQLTDSLSYLLSQMNISSNSEHQLNEEEHIDYKIISTQENIQKLNLKREKSTFLPTVSAFYTHQENLMSNNFEVFNGGSWYPANIIGVKVQIPLFSSGQRLSKVSQARIELDKVQNSKQMLSQSLLLKANSAQAEYDNAIDQYNQEKENRKLSKKIYDNYQIKYKNGMVSSMDLTQSQLQYLSTEDSYFQSIFTLLDAKDKLNTALGRD